LSPVGKTNGESKENSQQERDELRGVVSPNRSAAGELEDRGRGARGGAIYRQRIKTVGNDTGSVNGGCCGQGIDATGRYLGKRRNKGGQGAGGFGVALAVECITHISAPEGLPQRRRQWG